MTDLTALSVETRKATFQARYTQELHEDVTKHPERFRYFAREVPLVAAKMTAALARGTGNKDSNAIRRTCRALGIGFTYKEIFRWLNGTQAPQAPQTSSSSPSTRMEIP